MCSLSPETFVSPFVAVTRPRLISKPLSSIRFLLGFLPPFSFPVEENSSWRRGGQGSWFACGKGGRLIISSFWMDLKKFTKCYVDAKSIDGCVEMIFLTFFFLFSFTKRFEKFLLPISVSPDPYFLYLREIFFLYGKKRNNFVQLELKYTVYPRNSKRVNFSYI